MSVRLFYSYSYQDGFRIFPICGKDISFLVKNGEKMIISMKT